MKKVLALFIAVLALCSCEKTYFPDYSPADTLLGLNARLSTGDRCHTVFVDYCRHDSVMGAQDATVNIFVNGILAGSSSEAQHEYVDETRPDFRRDPPAWYYVNADIKPGDTVKVQALAGNYMAEATTVALPAPKLGNVVLTQLETTRNGFPYSQLKFNIQVMDPHAERNYYAISVSGIKEYQSETTGKYTVADLIEMDYSHDVLLFKHDVHVPESRAYVFSDSSFDGECISLDLRAGKDCFLDDNAVKGTAVVRLSAISMEDYDTYAMYERYLPDLPGLNTTVQVYPSNVVGGIGQVYVRSDTECSFLIFP